MRFRPADFEDTPMHNYRGRAWELWLTRPEWEAVRSIALAGKTPLEGGGTVMPSQYSTVALWHLWGLDFLTVEGEYECEYLRFDDANIELLCELEHCPSQERLPYTRFIKGMKKGRPPSEWPVEFLILGTQHIRPPTYTDPDGRWTGRVPRPPTMKILPRVLQWVEEKVPGKDRVLPLLHQFRSRVPVIQSEADAQIHRQAEYIQEHIN